MKRKSQSRKTDAEYFQLIVKHKLRVEYWDPNADLEDEDKTEIDTPYWDVFPEADGGHWATADDLGDAIDECIKENKLK